MTHTRTPAPDVTPTETFVSITGRIGTRIDERELPSGDTLTVFSIVVDRPKGGPSTVSVDTIPCRASKASVRRRVATLDPGDVVEATGRLHRRFWKSPNGLASALEVEVDSLKRAS